MSSSGLVWYASYGSNCTRERFLRYLQGGTVPGTDRHQLGARDPRDPIADAALEFDTALCFAGHSRTWGGAPAFLGHHAAPSDRRALGRRYLITFEQFCDVLAQENGRVVGTDPAALDPTSIEPGGRRIVGDGRYDAIVALAPVDGIPCLTFTSPSPPEDGPTAPPSATYLATIGHGLRAVHPLPVRQLATRLARAHGVSPTWDEASIADLLER